MRVEILRVAEDELLEAIEHYEVIESGLGMRLRDEVRRCLDWISGHHLLARQRSKGYRRVNLRVFPYYVAYAVRADILWVLAIAHSGRKPEYWSGRLKGV
jgi:hypothetical protein